MSVVIETSIGDLVIDLYCDERPSCCKNFLKLCKIKYYHYCLFYNVQNKYVAQTGDPTGSGRGGESIFNFAYGDQARYFEMERFPKIKHRKFGTISMINNGQDMHGSQRSDKYNKYITVETEEEPSLTQKDSKHILLDSYLYALKLHDNGANKISCALEFLGQNEHNCLRLAELAKKYISVPASSACVEGMFSIAGHIFSLRRRRLGIQVLMDFVWLKLNEAFY